MKQFSECLLLKQFLKNEAVAVISVDNGDHLHSAAMRYYSSEKPFRVYFVTDINSDKCKRLKAGEPTTDASCVIGLRLGVDYSIQMYGELKRFNDGDRKIAKKFHKKYANKRVFKDDDEVVLQFTPLSGKYTDYRGTGVQHRYELEFDE